MLLLIELRRLQFHRRCITGKQHLLLEESLLLEEVDLLQEVEARDAKSPALTPPMGGVIIFRKNLGWRWGGVIFDF